MGLASAAAWERHRWHPIGPAGIMAAAAALALILVGIWLEPSWRNEIFWKRWAVACVAGVALPTLGLLSTARLRREYGWVRRVTVMVVTILAGQIAFTFIAEVDDEVWGRMMGILAIASVCGVIAVPSCTGSRPCVQPRKSAPSSLRCHSRARGARRFKTFRRAGHVAVNASCGSTSKSKRSSAGHAGTRSIGLPRMFARSVVRR